MSMRKMSIEQAINSGKFKASLLFLVKQNRRLWEEKRRTLESQNKIENVCKIINKRIGKRQNHVILKPNDKAILQRLLSGHLQKDIGSEFGMSQEAVSQKKKKFREMGIL